MNDINYEFFPEVNSNSNTEIKIEVIADSHTKDLAV